MIDSKSKEEDNTENKGWEIEEEERSDQNVDKEWEGRGI
jgi:hypothetical protein